MAPPAISGTESPPVRPRGRLPWWKGLLFTLVLVLLVFAIPEGLLRVLNYPPPLQLPPEQVEIDVGGAGGKGLFWGLDANLTESPFLHKELGTQFYVSTNSRSMRYGEVPIGRQSKTVRLLALGDSTTFGWGVEQNGTYPAVLEQLLQSRHPDVKIEVINGGVPGYTSFQGLHHYKKDAAAYESDIVLFGYIVQDARKVKLSDKQQAIRAWEAREMRKLVSSTLYNFHLYRLFRDRYNWLRAYTFQKESDAETDPNGLIARVPLDDYRENIQEFQKETDGRSRLVLFGFPLEVVGYTREHRALLQDMAGTLKLDHFDPSRAVAEEARRRTLYFPKDRGHPNTEGCRFIAEQLAGYIEEKNLIGAALEARR